MNHIFRRLMAVGSLTLFTMAFVLPVSARTYTKIEVLELYSGDKLSSGYTIDKHTCDFDMETSDMVFYIYSAYTDGTIDGAWIKYLGHKYTNLTGLIKSKNKKFYQIVLKSDAGESSNEYGRMTFKLNIKKKNPDVGHGTVAVKRKATDNFAACVSQSLY